MYSPSNVEVIDGAVIFKMNPPTTSNTHGKYCDMELKANVLRITDSLQRVDIVFETYQRNAIKGDARDSAGKVSDFLFSVYKMHRDFMRCDDSKTKFFQMISSSLSKISCSIQIVRTKI